MIMKYETTTPDAAAAPQPTRGIIVVDSSELIVLSAKRFPAAMSSPLHQMEIEGEASGTYLDLLACLAQRGFRVIIPEAVMFETAAQTYSGHDLSEGNKNEPGTRTAIKVFLKKHEKSMVAAAADDTTPYGEHLAYVNNALPLQAAVREHDAPKILRSLQARMPEDAGEDHCIDVIQATLKEQGDSLPIFFLSADSQAREKLKCKIAQGTHYPNVNVLTSDGLLSALINDINRESSSALAELGLPQTLQANWDKILYSQNLSGQMLPKRPTENKTNPYYDAPIEDHPSHRFPFQDAVKGIAQELANERAAKETAAAETKPTTAPSGRLAKFLALKAKTDALQAQRNGGGNSAPFSGSR